MDGLGDEVLTGDLSLGLISEVLGGDVHRPLLSVRSSLSFKGRIPD